MYYRALDLDRNDDPDSGLLSSTFALSVLPPLALWLGQRAVTKVVTHLGVTNVVTLVT